MPELREVTPLPDVEEVPDTYRSLFDEATELDRDHFEFYHRSFKSTLASSIMMLSGVQCMRSAFTGGEFLTPSFGITLPLDVALTLTSHAIALNHIPFLKRIFDGEVFGSRYEAATRIGANLLMGVSYIYASWGMVGVNFTLTKLLMALGLCGVVYPTLYFLKGKVFKQLPLKRDLKLLKKFRSNRLFGAEFQKLESEIVNQAADKNIPEEEREYLVLSTLENLIFQHPYEGTIRRLPSLSERKEFQVALKKADGARLQSQKVKARVKLIELLLKVASRKGAAAEDARRVLELGGLLSQEGSLALMKAMAKRYRAHRKGVWLGSLVDQAVSVGIAGGIGLYEVNKFALSD